MNREQAIYQCVQLEQHAPDFGLHIGLTGGCLYKEGDRKDMDILLYRIRQVEDPDLLGFFERLVQHGWQWGKYHGWLQKMTTPNGDSVDFFYPERSQSEDDQAYGEERQEIRDEKNFRRDIMR